MALVRGFMEHERNSEIWPGWNQEFCPSVTLGVASVLFLNRTILAQIVVIMWSNAKPNETLICLKKYTALLI